MLAEPVCFPRHDVGQTLQAVASRLLMTIIAVGALRSPQPSRQPLSMQCFERSGVNRISSRIFLVLQTAD
ncbi:MAG: hypothetical protein DMG81_00785 [Acidobacteria bacterium]|nr:MAG: hypothetical protein DMG81_00785 [Acidobacteriota bacterium]